MAEVSSKTVNVSDEMKNILMEGQKEASFLEEAAKNVYDSLVNRVKTAAIDGVEIGLTTLALLNKALFLLFDPERGFVFLKDQIVALLRYFCDPLKEKDISPAAKPHLVLLQWNLTEANKTLEKMEKRITELLEFIESNFGRDVTKAELSGVKFKQNVINSDLDVCKMYCGKAQTELVEVEKAVGANILLRLIGTVGLMCAGAFAASAVCEAMTVRTSVVGTVVGTGVAYAAGATSGATLAIMKNFGSYAKWLTDFKNDKLPKLVMLNQKLKENEKRIEVLKENE